MSFLRPVIRALQQREVIVLLLVLGATALIRVSLLSRTVNQEQVFYRDQILFLDADSFSRMTRVKMILETPALLVKSHDFENHPKGTQPHTTAIFDYAIVSLQLLLRPFSDRATDLAGAWISPILGALMCGFLFFWVWDQKLRDGWIMLVLAAVSPLLVQATLLGRPDHQSLILFTLAVAICSEIAIIREPRPLWQAFGGIGWGLAIWTSLYEPGILFVLCGALTAILFPHTLHIRHRLIFYPTLGGILLLALLIEGIRLNVPGAGEDAALFSAWSKSVAELQSLGFATLAMMFTSVGWSILLLPVLPVAAYLLTQDRLAIWTGVLALVTLILAFWQLRWSFYAVLFFAICLPWMLAMFPRAWMAAAFIFLLSAYPIAWQWDAELFPEIFFERQAEDSRNERFSNLQSASWIKASEQSAQLSGEGEESDGDTVPQPDSPGSILAPWWMSPALVYWSGEPAVAGSSHQSLSGIADSFRFFASPGFLFPKGDFDPLKILMERDVEWIVLDDPERITNQAAIFFGKDFKVPNTPVAKILYFENELAPDFLQLQYQDSLLKHKVLWVDRARLREFYHQLRSQTAPREESPR